MELWLERSVLPLRLVTPDVAFDFHLDAFARWLRAAGAEARLALVHLSGPGARSALMAGLAARGCKVVEAPFRPGAPVHPVLAAHQGDHFNDKLFVVDGLDGGEPARSLREIGLQVSSFRRLATWVAVLIEGPETLSALETDGGILRRHAHRRFVFLSSEDTASGLSARPGNVIAESTVEKWARDHRIADRIHHLGVFPGAEPSSLDFARLVRSGYGGLRLDGPVHPDLVAMKALVSQPPRSQAEAHAWLARPSAALAELFARCVPDVARAPMARTSLAMALGADPAARFVARLPANESPLFSALGEVRDALDAGRPGPVAALRVLAEAPADLPPNLRVHVLLARAAAAIVGEAFDACEAALAAAHDLVAAEGLAITPELAFEVLEKRTGLQAALGERAHARAGLDQLAELLPRLHSPFYTGRHALARGEQMLALDPGKAREALQEAGMLFQAHAYDDWAAIARATAEG